MKEFYILFLKMFFQMELALGGALLFVQLVFINNGNDFPFSFNMWFFLLIPIIINAIAFPFLRKDYKKSIIRKEIEEEANSELHDAIVDLENFLKKEKTSIEHDEKIFYLKSIIEPEELYTGEYVLKVYALTENLLEAERRRREAEILLEGMKKLQ